jgi:hypothetical protein
VTRDRKRISSAAPAAFRGEPIVKFALLHYETADAFALRADPEKAPAYWAGWSAYGAAIVQAGIFVAGAGLLPPDTATSVRARDDARTVHDGPYADAKEQLGGFFVIDVADLDSALAWAAKAPSTTATTEVRPLLDRM